MSYLSPASYAQYQNERLITYVHDELRAAGRPYFSMPYPGSLRSHAYDGKRGEELPNEGRGEAGLRGTDVVIFDITSASLMHHCVENGIVYILVASRADALEFTPRQHEWFRVLRDAGLGFHDDEAGKLAAKLREIVSGSYELPHTVSDYHCRTFIDLPASAT